MAKSFLNKKGTANLQPAVIGIAERTGGVVLAGYVRNKLSPKLAPGLGRNARAAIMLGIGILGEAYVSNDHVQRVAQGMSTAASMDLLTNNLPSNTADKIGLSGMDTTEPEYAPGYSAMMLNGHKGANSLEQTASSVAAQLEQDIDEAISGMEDSYLNQNITAAGAASANAVALQAQVNNAVGNLPLRQSL